MTQLNGANVVAMIQARDSAGNVTVQALKGTLSGAFSVVSLPFIKPLAVSPGRAR